MLPADKMDNAANTVKLYYEKLISEQNVSSDRIFVVGSSSVASAKNSEVLKKKILNLFVGDLPPTVSFTTSDKETEYDILGVVPDKKRYSAVIVDAGAGNTEIGCLLPETEKTSFSFSIPYGSENMMNLGKEEQKKGTDYANAIKNIVKTNVEPTLVAQLDKSAALKTRKEIYLVGGTPWALATYLYPQAVNETYLSLTIADVGKLRDMSYLLYDKLINPDVSKITDAATKQKATEELKAVKEVFNKENLSAGALLLATTVNAINNGATDKKIIFARNGLTAWISGYAVQYITEGYKNK